MKTFNQWVTESSLKQQLLVPQNPVHHPEGSVFRHTMMVRASLKPAIKLLKKKQAEDPTGPLSNLDLNFTTEDLNILRFAALLHDIGKGDALNPETLSAHGHENPKTFEKAMRRLSPIWHQMYEKANPQDRDDLWWVIKYHMSLKDNKGFENKALKKEILDQNGNYLPDRRIKLLLVLLLMDRMGRGGEKDFSWSQAKQFAQSNIDAANKGLGGIYTTSDLYRQASAQKATQTNKSLGISPEEIVQNLRQKGRTSDQIRLALAGMTKSGKFNLSTEDIENLLKESRMSFKSFMESQETEPSTMKANIPLGVFENGATILSNLFKDAGYTIYVVGGTVRDYLMSKPESFSPKDVDFATNALSSDVKRVLDKAGIKYIAKGESFGVISAIIDRQEFEIATFREESGYEDKRRPTNVKPSDAKNDYRRRDFTFNALYYDMPREPGGTGIIIDFGGGKGFEDIKNKKVNTVGSAEDRFAEDPLRVLRGVRFHGIFNTDHLKDVLDPITFDAMKKFSNLEGVSPERIQAEFVASLIKAKDPRIIIHGFDAIGALPYMFPGMSLDIDAVDHLTKLPSSLNVGVEDKEKHNHKKVILTLALLLRKNGSPDNIRKRLNQMKWPNDVVDEVVLLIKSWLVSQNPNSQDMSQHAVSLYKKNPDLRRELIKDFHPMVGHEVDQDHLSHLGNYEPTKFSGEDIQKELGLSKMGPEIGARMKELQASDYEKSFKNWRR